MEFGGVWWSLVKFGGVWWSLVEFGGDWWSLVVFLRLIGGPPWGCTPPWTHAHIICKYFCAHNSLHNYYYDIRYVPLHKSHVGTVNSCVVCSDV